MNSVTRRSALRSAVWTAPAVAIAFTPPAFAAASDVSTCSGYGWYKDPGEGSNTKDYYVSIDCGYNKVVTVSIYDDVDKIWRDATLVDGDLWVAKNFNDSRRNRKVLINGSQTILVSFASS